MPDITMCTNRDCPLKYGCYRFVAKPDKYWQPYSDFKFFVDKENKVKCLMRMELPDIVKTEIGKL